MVASGSLPCDDNTWIHSKAKYTYCILNNKIKAMQRMVTLSGLLELVGKREGSILFPAIVSSPAFSVFMINMIPSFINNSSNLIRFSSVFSIPDMVVRVTCQEKGGIVIREVGSSRSSFLGFFSQFP